MASKRTLLKNGCVLTLDPVLRNFWQADVLIEGHRIAEVGPNLEAAEAEEIDASNMIVMPGFVDTHRHTWQGGLRNIAANATLNEYFADIRGTLAPVYQPEDAYAGNLIGALGAIEAGITTMLDWSHIQNTPEHTDAVIHALRESGLRSVFAYGTWWSESSEACPEAFKRVATQYFSSDDQLLTLALAPRGPELTTMEVACNDWQLAREAGARITVHVGGGRTGQQRKLAQLGREGVLGPDTTYVHCCTLSDEEVQMIVDTGGTVSFATPIEMQMGHGTPPVQRFLDRGLRPSLSIDVETSITGDMFTQMRTIFALQRALVHERMLQGEEDLPPLLTTRDVLEFATIEGARANGLDHKIGTLTPGKEADIILLRSDRLNVTPLNDPIGAVVLGMDTSNVDSVFIGGKAMKRHGTLVGVDVERVRRLAIESRDRLVEAAGFTLPAI